ncbi:MFS transporter [Streptomyces sp. NPDC048248]|uniref:MFS transporter n=1 Tax=Streptomyces sp. NPDC048248 TaxID=3365523 RepID=UPI00371D6C69
MSEVESTPQTPTHAPTGTANVPGRPMPRAVVLLLSISTGLSAASLYYAQPLLDAIRHTLHMGPAGASAIVAISQAGYVVGLLFLVPLGDLVERRRLSVTMTLASAGALVLMATATSALLLTVAALVVGILSVTAQMQVAFTATLAPAHQRGQVVGTVMSGLIIGVLLARTAAGALASLGGWRLVFWVAAGLMLILAPTLRAALPASPSTTTMRYGQVLTSAFTLLRREPVLRLRAAYGGLAFAIYSVLWTPLALMLAARPFHYSAGVIGLFGLAGVAGAMAARVAGRFADRGHTSQLTTACAVLLVLSWIPLALGQRSLTALLAGIVVLDLAVVAMHITNQSEIYRLSSQARSRITSAYMSMYFFGGVVGSSLASLLYTQHGWSGVSVLGAGLGAVVLALRLTVGRLAR